MSRPSIRGSHSAGLLKSSPMAMGVVEVWRMRRNHSLSFGRQGVFEEEQVEGFELLREDDGVGGREPLVGVVEQFHLAAHGRAQVLEHPDRAAHVAPRVEIVAGFRALGRRDPRLPASVSADLAAHVPVVLLHVPLDVLRHFLGRCAVGVDVRVRRLPALSAEELVHGHARPFPLDVPQRHVHAGDRVVQHRAVAPVPVHHGRLPQVLDIVRVLADEEGVSGGVRWRCGRPGTAG